MAAQTQQQQPVVSIELNATDVIGAAGVLASLVAAALFRRLRAMGRQLRDMSRPSLLLPRDLSRAKELLAQLAILTGADRALLGLFHNGALDSSGFHLAKLQILAGYFGPDIDPIPEFLRIVPITEIPEIRRIWQSPDGVMRSRVDDPMLTQGCREYLERRGMQELMNITLSAGETEVGMVGLHFVRQACLRPEVMETPEVKAVLAELTKLSILRSSRPFALGAMHLQR